MAIDRTIMIVIGLLNIPPTFMPSRFSKWFLEATIPMVRRRPHKRAGHDASHNGNTTKAYIYQPTKYCPWNGFSRRVGIFFRTKNCSTRVSKQKNIISAAPDVSGSRVGLPRRP